jgi:hypothetical protein
MTDVALGMVTPKSGIGVPVDGAVAADLEGRVAVLIEILAVLVLDGSGIAAAVGNRESRQRQEQGGHRKADAHRLVLVLAALGRFPNG